MEDQQSPPNWEFGLRPELGAGGAFTPPPRSEGAAPAEQPRRSSDVHRILRTGAVLAAAAAIAGAVVGHYAWPSAGSSDSEAIQAPSQGQAENPFGSLANPFGQGTGNTAATQALVNKVSPAMVDINTTLGYQSSSAAGTGMVLSSDGYVLTNNHVINGSTSITATDLGDSKTYKATVVGYDRSHDVAVIKLTGASGLTVASFGNSSNVAVGQSVVGIGNAGGQGTPTAAAGTVTALDQSITAQDESASTSEQLSGLIQTNAPIQPGQSGGPLVNTDAKVVGMVTAASAGYSFSGQGTQGFAIPIDQALSIARAITAGHGSSSIHLGPTAFLGVQLTPSTRAVGATGAQVQGALDGSAAAAIGLAAGDTITAVDGNQVTSPEGLSHLLIGYHPGDRVRITWTDAQGASHTATATLGSGPNG
jgi:S1-C subfamily serine protease